MQNFKFGKHWLSQFGGRLLESPKIEIAQRAVEIIEIPGKDGSLFQDLGYYKNVEFERKIGMLSPLAGVTSKELIDSFINWLGYSIGYQEFRDTQHNGFFTKAILTNFESVERELRIYSSATLKFNRLPVWYSDAGQVEKTFTINTANRAFKLLNPYQLDAKYFLKIYTETSKTSTVQLGINYQGFCFHKPSGYDYVEIDLENLTVKSVNSSNKSTKVEPPGTYMQYPLNRIPLSLQPGENIVTFDSTQSNPPVKIEIIPKWRKL